MKSKLFKVLGVVAIVAMLATALVAPAAAVSGVSASVTAGSAIIGAAGNYTIGATIANQLNGSNGGSIILPYITDAVTFTGVAGNKVTVSLPGITPILTGAAAYAGGVVSFTGAGTAVFAAVANNTTGSYAITVGSPTAAITATKASPAPTYVYPNYSLPAVGDSFIITAHTDATATLPAATTGSYAVTFSAGTGSYTAPTITFGTSTTATVTAMAASTTGAWTTLATATAALGTNVYPTAASVAAPVANGDKITITFPAGFTIAAPGAAPLLTGTIAASSGWITGATPPPVYGASVLTSTVLGSSGQTVTFTLGENDVIGVGAQIFINLPSGVANPSTAGTYTLTVQTSQETTAVTSKQESDAHNWFKKPEDLKMALDSIASRRKVIADLVSSLE